MNFLSETLIVKYFLHFCVYLQIIIYVMGREKPVLLPKHLRILEELGTNIKLARLRRKFSTQQVSERANISRPTLLSIEKGSESVSIGLYLQVLMVLGLEKDLLMIARDDVLGRKLQDANLITKDRAPKKASDGQDR
jgi:DNA-binding XRE family transcriptional regulator